jgi:deazaflavin-dependent oxidoreductase (nitroreductase family)
MLGAVNYLDLAERSWPVLNRLMGVHAWVYRATGGRIGEHVPGVKAPMLLLDHVGARSGAHRTSPLLYVPDGDQVAIIASKGGYPKNPAWFHNLQANPDTSVQIGTERRPVTARIAAGDERERIWSRAVELWPQYRAYQERTERQIPVVVLERRAA